MKMSYNKLWKLLIDKGMTKTEMRKQAGISSSSLAKLGKGETVEYGGLELTAEAARFYTSGRARFTPPGGHILQ